MWPIKQWNFVITLLCVTQFTLLEKTFAEEPAMSRQQQCAEYGVYQDASENWIDCAEDSSSSYSESEYRESEYREEVYVEDTYVEETYTEETYVEPPYAEDRYVEDAYVEDAYIEEPYVN